MIPSTKPLLPQLRKKRMFQTHQRCSTARRRPLTLSNAINAEKHSSKRKRNTFATSDVYLRSLSWLVPSWLVLSYSHCLVQRSIMALPSGYVVDSESFIVVDSSSCIVPWYIQTNEYAMLSILFSFTSLQNISLRTFTGRTTTTSH